MTEDRRVSEQQAAIEGYQAYAKGGAKEHDAILNQIAGLEQQSLSTSLESHAEEDLIPGTSWNAPSPGAQDGNKQAKPNPQPEINLLDDW
jgi:helicase required for RNAi-mediated heterochromatin assembly 1